MTKKILIFSLIEDWKTEKKDNRKNMVNIRIKLSLFCILILFTTLSCYKQYEKKGDHVDEKLTYTLANDTGNYYFPINQKITTPQKALDIQLTTNEYNPPFNYANVWKNQHSDTHPPFYYALVHTISSFFIGKYSPWFAFTINLIFGIATVIFVYKICLLFLDSEVLALFCSLLFAVHPAIIEMTTFLRMYVMVTFFCVLLSYWILKNWGNFNLHFFAGNMLILICGTLTHYYFIVYAFFHYAVIALYLLTTKNKRNFLRLLYSLCVAVCTTVICFYGIIRHLLKGGRGTENIKNFFNLSDYTERITEYFKIINKDLFHYTFLIFIIAALIGYALSWKKKDYIYKWRLSLIGTTMIGYFFIVSKVASYITDRYISLLYPLLILTFCIGILFFVKYLAKESKLIISLFCIILLFAESLVYRDYTWKYSGIYYQNTITEKIKNAVQYDCICILNSGWEMWPHYLEFIQYPSLTITNMEEINKLDMSQYPNKKIVVYVSSSLEFDNKKLLTIFDQYTAAEKLYEGYAYFDCYCLYY
ncbi:MAG: hypothetical protein HDR12_00765 [Lachnospiraceae bacterium]|nr:hypothetical protein [Lachnospiraceae bacterium]